MIAKQGQYSPTDQQITDFERDLNYQWAQQTSKDSFHRESKSCLIGSNSELVNQINLQIKKRIQRESKQKSKRVDSSIRLLTDIL